MANWMQQLKETYSHMVYSRLLHEGGSLNVGAPGQQGEPMQPAMRPMRPGESRREYQEYGDRERKKLETDWDEAEAERNDAIIKTGIALGSPLMLVGGGIGAAAGLPEAGIGMALPAAVVGGTTIGASQKSRSPSKINPFRGQKMYDSYTGGYTYPVRPPSFTK